jgi:hypothetical protein
MCSFVSRVYLIIYLPVFPRLTNVCFPSLFRLQFCILFSYSHTICNDHFILLYLNTGIIVDKRCIKIMGLLISGRLFLYHVSSPEVSIFSMCVLPSVKDTKFRTHTLYRYNCNSEHFTSFIADGKKNTVN